MHRAPRTDQQALAWTVTIQIPVQRRLVRRASEAALAAHLAKALGESFKKVPVAFIVSSVERLRAELKKDGPRLLIPGA